MKMMPDLARPFLRKTLCLLLMLLLQNATGYLVIGSGYACIIPADIPEAPREPYPRDLLLGHFEPSTHPDFEQITGYNAHPRMFLYREAKHALDSLVAAAAEDGVHLNVISATRNFTVQKRIWENKIAARSAGNFKRLDRAGQISILQSLLKYSAMPSTSRHHWGTDVDFLSVELSFWRGKTGQRTSAWLKDNASRFGYALVYTNDRQGGYNYEPWHWSYLPLAELFLEDYQSCISYHDLENFSGAELAEELNIFPHFVQNVFASNLP